MKEAKPEKNIILGAFPLDPVNECLWREGQMIPLAPKDFAALLYLVERPNRLMPKEELLKALWPDTTVSEGVLLDDLKRFLEHVAREEVT